MLQMRTVASGSLLKFSAIRPPIFLTIKGHTWRWYREWSPQSGRDKIEAKTETAYSNHRSFWFTKGELVRALYDAGFSSVEEQTEPLGDFYSKYPSSFFGSRILVAIK